MESCDNLCPKVVWHDPMNLPNTYQEKTPSVNRRSEIVKGASLGGRRRETQRLGFPLQGASVARGPSKTCMWP